MSKSQNPFSMEISENEWTICPAIWVDDGKQYADQPPNIASGYVVYGNHLVDIFYRMNNRNIGKPIDIANTKLNDVHEGYFTNKGRFVEKIIKY